MWDIQLVGVVLELTMGILSVLCSGQCCVCLVNCVVSVAAGKSSLSSPVTVLTALESLRVCWGVLVALPLHWPAFIEGLLYCQIALPWVCIVLCCYSYIKSPSVISDRLWLQRVIRCCTGSPQHSTSSEQSDSVFMLLLHMYSSASFCVTSSVYSIHWVWHVVTKQWQT